MVKLSEAVREATRFVVLSTAAGTAAEIAVFLVLHFVIPEVPFGADVILSAVLGWLVASGNFFLMAIAAEKSANDDNYDNAKKRMSVSYRYRTFLQLAFIVVAILVPFLNWVAALIPLLIPSLAIKAKGIFESRRPSTRTEGIDWEDEEEPARQADPAERSGADMDAMQPQIMRDEDADRTAGNDSSEA